MTIDIEQTFSALRRPVDLGMTLTFDVTIAMTIDLETTFLDMKWPLYIERIIDLEMTFIDLLTFT